MLQRFEELVLYDGEPVFLKPETPNNPAAAASTADSIPASVTPARQFQTLLDVADWIARNWPDFDLETKRHQRNFRNRRTFRCESNKVSSKNCDRPGFTQNAKARQEALSELVDIVRRDLEHGNAIYEIVYPAISQLHEANLELAVSADERMAVIEANLRVLKSLEAEAQGRRDAGTLSESDYLLTVTNRFGEEIELLKAKRK